MNKVINLNRQEAFHEIEISQEHKNLIAERKKAKREPLTAQKLRGTPGLENLTDQEASEAIEAIQKLAEIFFEIASQNQTICIDNQQVVNLDQQNKAA
jgi:hypothetical protein